VKHEVIQHYYGAELQSSADLKTDACCTPDDLTPYQRKLLGNVHEDVLARYYGCGLIVPAAMEGARVLDLGCGAGRDVYVLAQMVGETGTVIGVDMTPQQLDVARSHEDWQRDKFGYSKANTQFLDGIIEDLEALPLDPASFDVVVSNCVVNLALDKQVVLEGVRRLLKPGGEMYFSDVYADRRLSPSLKIDPALYGECLGGALYWNDFLCLAGKAGFADPRLVVDRPLEIGDLKLKSKLGEATFFSATYRLFNIDGLEGDCEDYGQAVIYRGGIFEMEDAFVLDCRHLIEKGRVFPVCGNTWRMLRESRFSKYFEFIGSTRMHYGIFPGCGRDLPFHLQAEDPQSKAGCR
jgi:arsenite methyltransferase